MHHDLLLELLRSAEQFKIFSAHFAFQSDEEKILFQESSDIFEWFMYASRDREREDRRIVNGEIAVVNAEIGNVNGEIGVS